MSEAQSTLPRCCEIPWKLRPGVPWARWLRPCMFGSNLNGEAPKRTTMGKSAAELSATSGREAGSYEKTTARRAFHDFKLFLFSGLRGRHNLGCRSEAIKSPAFPNHRCCLNLLLPNLMVKRPSPTWGSKRTSQCQESPPIMNPTGSQRAGAAELLNSSTELFVSSYPLPSILCYDLFFRYPRKGELGSGPITIIQYKYKFED